MSTELPRWTKLEDGCVRDNILYTRLDGTQFQLEWTPFLGRHSFDDAPKAVAECQLLGGGWKVPSPHQLFSTINTAKYGPAMDEEIADGITEGWGWTDQIDPSDSSCAFYVYFGLGHVRWNSRYGSGLVRACREVPPRQ